MVIVVTLSAMIVALVAMMLPMAATIIIHNDHIHRWPLIGALVIIPLHHIPVVTIRITLHIARGVIATRNRRPRHRTDGTANPRTIIVIDLMPHHGTQRRAQSRTDQNIIVREAWNAKHHTHTRQNRS